MDDIIGQYKKADFTIRLNIYLAYPELRDEFIRIDTEYPDFTAPFNPDDSLIDRLSHLVNRWVGIF